MSEDSKPYQNLPLPEGDSITLPQKSPHTAAAKLHEVTTKYNELVYLAEMSQQRYNVHHENLHHINNTIHEFASRISDRGVRQITVMDAIGCYSQATDGLAEQLSEDMVAEREKWNEFVKEARVVKNQMLELRRLVAAKERMVKQKGGVLKHEVMEHGDAVVDEYSAEEEKRVLGA